MRILVTGGAGFVGLPMCRRLTELGHQVCAIDDLTCGEHRGAELATVSHFVRASILDGRAIACTLESFQPEVVVHLAAMHFIPDCNRRPVDTVDINVLGTASVLDACARVSSITRVILTSSAAVYPISDGYMTESDAAAPTDIYGITKAANERQARAFSCRTGIRTVTVRLYNVYGPGETNPHVIPEIIDQIRKGVTQLKLGNVSPKRNYVYVDDVVSGYVSLLDAPLPDGATIVNLGSRDEASVRDVVECIGSALHRPIHIVYDEARGRKSDREYLRCDPTKLETLTGWRAAHTIESGLTALLRAESLL